MSSHNNNNITDEEEAIAGLIRLYESALTDATHRQVKITPSIVVIKQRKRVAHSCAYHRTRHTRCPPECVRRLNRHTKRSNKPLVYQRAFFPAGLMSDQYLRC